MFRAYNVSGDATMLLRMDGATGMVLQRIPMRARLDYIAHTDVANFTQPPQIVPAGEDSLAVVDPGGRVVLLAPAPAAQRPTLTLSDTYPAPGRLVTLRVAAPGGAIAERTLVRWGDGAWEDLAGADLIEHAYPTPARYEILVTQQFVDGRTGTASAVVEVGGTPLTTMQRVFSPENQNWTFFVLGLAVTGIGATAGVLRLRRSRRAFERASRALDELARASPSLFEDGLHVTMGQARMLAADGTMSAVQLAVIERRAIDLTSKLRKSLLRDEFSFLPTPLFLLLEEMLADGRITTWEHRHFLTAVDHEASLDPGQKARVQALVRRWLDTDAALQRH